MKLEGEKRRYLEQLSEPPTMIFGMGCIPPSFLLIEGSHPKMKLEGEETSESPTMISEWGVTPPPFSALPELALQFPTMISEWGVTPLLDQTLASKPYMGF